MLDSWAIVKPLICSLLNFAASWVIVRSPRDNSIRAYQYSAQAYLVLRLARNILQVVIERTRQHFEGSIPAKVKQHSLAIVHQFANPRSIFELEVGNAVTY